MSNKINFAIVIATYYRPDGSTLKKISKTFENIINQSYDNWTIILVGDKYENQEEFDKIVKLIPPEKIIYQNLDYAHERDMYNNNLIDRKQLWCKGGSNAMREGIILAKNKGFNYIARLDDDDVWYPNHLAHLNEVYKKYPEAAFVYTSGYVWNYTMVPPLHMKICYNNLEPRGGHVLHSTVSWRLDKIDINYHKIDIQKDKRILNMPADSMMWTKIAQYCKANSLFYVYYPVVTVFHDNS
jgi:glycosyltransferase involved in cell wall biosynthesis